MNLKNYLTIAFILSFVTLMGFGLIALMISKDMIVKFDHEIISLIQGFEHPTLTIVFMVFTFIGSTKTIIALFLIISFILFKVLKHRSEFILFIAVMIGSNISFFGLKTLFQRERPDIHRLIEVTNFSFPSGHATNSIAIYATLTFLSWRHIPTQWGRTLLVLLSIGMISTIGISRIYLGVHYPSDVLAGYFAGGFWLTFAIWIYQRYQEKHNEISLRV